MYKVTTLIIVLLSLIFVGSGFAQTVPPVPTNLTVEQMMSSALLKWDSSTGAHGYKIYKALDTLPFVPIAATKMPVFVDLFVPPGHVYHYYVTAFNIYGESLPSNDVVFVPSGPPPNHLHGFITGTIVDDSSGLPVPGVRVRFFRPDGFVYFREARTDTFGYYSMALDTGKYLVHASKWTYVPEWFENALTHQTATPVVVTAGDTSIANFGLKRIPPPPPPQFVSVSGTVIDSMTGNPVRAAYVVIMRPNRMINMMQNQDGAMFGSRNETFFLEEFGTLLGVIHVVRTDSNGNYSVRVPDSLRYIMLAAKPGYIPEFYKDKKTPFDADRLLINGDTTGINFDLIPYPPAHNSVSGMVKNSDGNGVISKVILFHVTPRGMFPVRCAITDTLGNYIFRYLYKGFYFAKAVPFAYYAPAWYDKDTCGTMFWLHAAPFLVDSVTTDIDICVKPISTGGLASIGGIVRETGSLMQGVTVYAVSNVSSEVVGYDITEDDGIFSIQNLAPGSYTLVVDKEGYNASASPIVNVDASNNYTVGDADVNLTGVTAVDDHKADLPDKYSLRQNYPNPFNPETKIRFTIIESRFTTLKVYDVLGRVVATLVNEVKQPGEYSVQWDASGSGGLSGGVYFYRLVAKAIPSGQAGDYIETKKLVLMK